MTKPMTRTIIAAGVSALFLAVGIGAYTTYAQGPNGDFNSENYQARHENREAVKQALSSNDFEAWSSLIADHPRVEEMANRENFETMVKVHDLLETGDREAAHELMKEKGIKIDGYNHRGHFDVERQEKMQAIFESGDYEAWSELMSDRPMFADHLNEENFNLHMKAHELRQAGNIEGARELLQESGVSFKNHGRRMFSKLER